MITDTIAGRQCMASCFFILRQFEDVLVYLNSIKVSSTDDFYRLVLKYYKSNNFRVTFTMMIHSISIMHKHKPLLALLKMLNNPFY
jgi:hypothetical protein